MNKLKKRESGIEMLKIIGIFLIIISHVTQTLYTPNEYFDMKYVVEVKYATKNIQNILLAWFSSFGAQGNLIFFICSAYFLLENKKIDDKKIIRLLIDVWVINFSILCIFVVGSWYELSIKIIIKSIFPTIFATNWYITFYILFYLIHLGLNLVIQKITQKDHLIIILITLLLYFGLNYIKYGLFFTTPLIEFSIIYFVIAYIKLYLKKFSKNLKLNYILFLISILGIQLLILVTNFLGLNIGFFYDKLQHWNKNNSIFLLLTAISLFNIFNSKKFINDKINYISSLSLLIYIIHENIIIRTYLRPTIWIYIHERIGYKYIILLDLLYSIIVFIISMIIAWIYKRFIQNSIYKMVIKIYEKIKIIINKIVMQLTAYLK
ncbi:acyltransferase family protein [Fusobacterium mortiferum]|uniref:acyltransferase family protein n=1 Tax=Fusobacterium mortiferum TaxID=850 RepID=UPI0022DFEB8B|nr:acyltransferase family protein [Fusobacterium mortiferum]